MSGSVQAKVEEVHRRVIRLDRTRLLARLTTVAMIVLAVAVGVDALVRWPSVVRFVLLAVGLFVAVRGMRKVIDRGWLRAPAASSVALRLERVEPTLQGVLASAYEFERSGERARNGLAATVVAQADEAWRTTHPARHVRWSGAGRWSVATTALCAAWFAFAIFRPGEASIGLRRSLTPWTGDQWPARVALEPSMPAGAVARGASVPLRVRVTRGDEQGLRVRAVCSTREAGRDADGAEREYELARQADGSFERPVIAEGASMRVRFVAGDGETDPFEFAVVTPPAIERGSIEVEPPAYAAKDQPSVRSAWQGVAMPDTGSVLAGSQVTIRVELAAPAPDIAADALQAFDDRGQTTDLPGAVAEDATHWRIQWTAERSGDIFVRPRDAAGVQAPEALRVPMRVLPDSDPTVSVTEPEADEVVTVDATVPFRIEARDDLGLAWIGWRLDRQQRSGEPGSVTLREASSDSTVREASLADQLSIASVQAKVGDTLLLRGVAKDRLARPGVIRAAVLSDARKLRVVEREAFERQVRQQVAALRQASSRLEASQQEIAKDPDAASAARSEAGLVERVHQGNDAARRLVQRLRRNGLQELPLTETLQEAGRLGDQAEREAVRAQDALREAASGSAEAMARAKDAQRATEEALREMVELLDRDDDAAAAQRRADRLAESIAKLRDELRQAARPAAGKSPEELTASERQALQEQAARQRTAAAEASAMVDDLRARAERLESKDRAQSKSLRAAADEGEKGQASRRMDEAADRTDRNQATAADEAMQAAAEAVDRMREALREDRRARTEDLRRRLASLAETLQALIGEGEAVLRAIDAPDEQVVKRLLQLARNTASAAEEARAGDRPLQRVAGGIERAAERFDAGAVPLRSQPIDGPAARDAVSRGVDLLREALKGVQEAQRREQERASERERAQLERQYRDLAAQVRSVREATAGTVPPAGGRLDRRGAAVQREQAQRVQGVQRAIESGPKAAESVRKAETFGAVHARVDRDLEAARVALEAMQGDGSTVRRLDMAAESLEALAAALAEPEQPEDPFADGADQGGQAGGAGGAQGEQPEALPPIVELKVVRQLQQQALQWTRTLEASRSAGANVESELRDLAAMQDEVRRLGEDWIRRMEESNAARKAVKPGAEPKATPKPVDAFPAVFGKDDALVKPVDPPVAAPPVASSPPTSPPTSPSTSPPTPPSPEAAPRTLDELLGIGGSGGTDEAARMQRERQLKRSLDEEDLDDLAKAATESMDLATTLVRDRQETGLGTQRVQRQAVESLDALIDAATRFSKQQQQQQKKGSQGKSGQRKPSKGQSAEDQAKEPGEPQPAGQQAQAQRSDGQREPGGATGDQVEPPPPEDAAMAASGTLVEGRSEWGRLPQRIREIMSQARRDRISAIYQQATEAYYRRLAEERGP